MILNVTIYPNQIKSYLFEKKNCEKYKHYPKAILLICNVKINNVKTITHILFQLIAVLSTV